MNITDGTDFVGSGFFIMDDSFEGLVQKVKDKRMVFQKNFIKALNLEF